jgi:hypothetical protein
MHAGPFSCPIIGGEEETMKHAKDAKPMPGARE